MLLESRGCIDFLLEENHIATVRTQCDAMLVIFALQWATLTFVISILTIALKVAIFHTFLQKEVEIARVVKNADSSLLPFSASLFSCPVVMLMFWGTSVFVYYYYVWLSKRRKYWKKVGWGSEIRTWKRKIFKGNPDILPVRLFGYRPIWDPGESCEPAQKKPHRLKVPHI